MSLASLLAPTEIAVMIRRSLETVGRAADTELTAFTDGAPGLRSILSEAGYKKPPIADWFHIAMRLQHAKQAASGLSTDTPGRMQAKAAIVPEGAVVDRTPNLQQQVGTPWRPSHLLCLVHPSIDQEVGRALGH
jgi:hypothetical protein